MNTARAQVSGAGTIQTSALAYGGNTPPATNKTEAWNGSSWSELNDLSTSASAAGGNGSSSSALQAGGYNGSTYITTTEEWTADLTNKTITTS